jgi:hypothetical protein
MEKGQHIFQLMATSASPRLTGPVAPCLIPDLVWAWLPSTPSQDRVGSAQNAQSPRPVELNNLYLIAPTLLPGQAAARRKDQGLETPCSR